jgi:hypothetical protein
MNKKRNLLVMLVALLALCLVLIACPTGSGGGIDNSNTNGNNNTGGNVGNLAGTTWKSGIVYYTEPGAPIVISGRGTLSFTATTWNITWDGSIGELAGDDANARGEYSRSDNTVTFTRSDTTEPNPATGETTGRMTIAGDTLTIHDFGPLGDVKFTLVKNTATPGQNKFSGRWECTSSMAGSTITEGVGDILIFNDDLTWIRYESNNVEDSDGTYTYDGNTASLIPTTGNSILDGSDVQAVINSNDIMTIETYNPLGVLLTGSDTMVETFKRKP